MVEGDQAEERFSTGGLEFKQALRRVLAGGREDEQATSGPEEDMSEVLAGRELTDEELVAVIETTRSGVADGTIPLVSDERGLREDIRRRFSL